MRKIILLTAFILLLTVPTAFADSYGLGFAGSYNTFIFGDFSNTSDTQGRLAVGGNANLYGYSVGDQLPYDKNDNVLVVGGDLNFTSGRVYGTAVVGGSATLGHANIADGGVFTNQPMPFSFSDERQRLTGLASSLSQRASTGSVVNNWGHLTLTGSGSNAIQVFNVSGSDMLNANGLSLSNIGADDTVIINVSGLTSGLTNMGMNDLANKNDKVLFNFYEANELSLYGVGVQGSILAPLADIDNATGVIYGTIIAGSLNGSIQQDHHPFTGNTPIPAAAWLLGSGLFGLIGARKVRRS